MPRRRAIANVVLKARHSFEQIVDRPMDRRERIWVRRVATEWGCCNSARSRSTLQPGTRIRPDEHCAVCARTSLTR